MNQQSVRQAARRSALVSGRPRTHSEPRPLLDFAAVLPGSVCEAGDVRGTVCTRPNPLGVGSERGRRCGARRGVIKLQWPGSEEGRVQSKDGLLPK